MKTIGTDTNTCERNRGVFHSEARKCTANISEHVAEENSLTSGRRKQSEPLQSEQIHNSYYNAYKITHTYIDMACSMCWAEEYKILVRQHTKTIVGRYL